MTSHARPFRSVLYIPASKERALEKAKALPVDAIIFDLEDAVAVEEKENARNLLSATLLCGSYGGRARIVRINGLDTPWGKGDAEAARQMKPDAVLLPKVNSSADIDALVEITGKLDVWAMIETPMGILNASEIAAHPRVKGFVIGTNDLAKELTTRYTPDRQPLLMSLQLCLLAARAHDVVAIDGVYNAFKDDAGLLAECEQGRDMGFDGKTLIHPAQLATANAAFAPSDEELELARRQIVAFETARANGEGVAVVDGKIVENLHIVTARQTLAKSEAIAALATE
ncbi:HpcH/HpaI aldolase/citrate lyase family protein [Cochlodiniinecator piscidefendens]|uniref:HpcH/HpaI aldolase/citrate lyase family protein n=1 Tax=Cochlodiniinecator piscidefendens TaxID=2715756 RepID=UPI00140785B4|nr:CoA ester lyase [Cochlodiniinecator piscidefendens]